VKPGVHKPEARSLGLVEPRDESSPQRRDRARATDDRRDAIDQNAVAGLAVAVAGDIGHSAAGFASGIRRLRHAGLLLIYGQLEYLAHAAPGRPTVVSVLYGLETYRAVLCLEVCGVAIVTVLS